MKNIGILALFGALATAAPLVKRDVVWVTETAVDVVTVPVTKTVWMEPGSTDIVSAKEDYRHRATQTVTATVSSATSVASTSSVYVAPTSEATTEATTEAAVPSTTSTSVYVAPTTPTTSSVYVAPTTSTSSIYVAPTTSTSVAPTTSEVATSTSAAPAASSSYASTSGLPDTSSGAEYSGQITNYTPGLGSCGWTNTDSEDIVAVSHTIMTSYNPQNNPNNNPLCGRYITITGADGSPYTAKVVDTCPGCEGQAGLDLPLPLYNKVTNSDTNAPLTLEWVWN
ncbi:hypothetical protein M8818_002254 [Zalaria obscura]|uniref:Uncharacterized protein n=1 Tax=Zalaria obscura TaxID=2024903 RepID=A0ACC3SIQ7_9PEZI